jgi:hypothetical protein
MRVTMSMHLLAALSSIEDGYGMGRGDMKN